MIQVKEKSVMNDNVYVNISILLELIDDCIMATDGLKEIINTEDLKDQRKIGEASGLLSSAREILAELDMQL